MPALKKAIIKSYDAAEHKATVQIAGSLGVWLDGVRVATDIPASDVVAGRECTVLFLDPSNPDDAVVITVQGALPSGGGGGSTTFIGLTDTPASYAGAALQTLRVNSGASAVEFHDLYAAAHAWAALQTFNAGIKLAASQQIQDSGGTGRILLATASPNITLTGATRIDSNAAIACAPSLSPDIKLSVSPITTGVTDWRGIQISPALTFTGSSKFLVGLCGAANVTIPAASSGHNISGLDFLVTLVPAGAASAAARAIACSARPGIVAIGSGKSLTVTDLKGFETNFDNLTVIFATATLTNVYGLHIKGATLNTQGLTVTSLYGIRVENFDGASIGNNYLMEVGPSTPYLRVVGGAAPGANLTNLYLNENGTLRRVQWKDGASIGAGDKALVLV